MVRRWRDAVDRIQAETIPKFRELIIDRLIELLKGRSDTASSRAVDLLVHFGEFAPPALSHKRLNSPDSRMVQRIASILGTMGAKAPPYSQVSIQMNLDFRFARTRDKDVLNAILKALDRNPTGLVSVDRVYNDVRQWALGTGDHGDAASGCATNKHRGPNIEKSPYCINRCHKTTGESLSSCSSICKQKLATMHL